MKKPVDQTDPRHRRTDDGGGEDGVRDASLSSVEAKLEFETLLANLSSRFINLPCDQIDREIEHAQQQICEALDLDRSSLGELDPETDEVFITHSWALPGLAVNPRIRASELFPWLVGRLRAGNEVCYRSVDELPPEAAVDLESLRRIGQKSSLSIPLTAGGQFIGGVAFGTVLKERDWPDALVSRLRLVAEIFANAIERRRSEVALRQALAEVSELKSRYERENVYLRQEAYQRFGRTTFVGRSPALLHTMKQIEQVAPTGATVLLLGETGTGKGLLASIIHELSPRRERVLVQVNCAAIPGSLVESELFGREKGAYTGALSQQIGRFELAHESTLFLDEIGEVGQDVQLKLLRVLEEKKIERLGSPRSVTVDVRIVAATNLDLERAVREGRFREDLYYRLNVFPITVPPLRLREGDIPLLVWSFVNEFATTLGKTVESIDETSLDELARYPWPGNVRELRNVVERAVIVATGPRLHIDVPSKGVAVHRASAIDGTAPGGAELPDLAIDETQRAHILGVLAMTGWRIRGARGAAELLSIKPTTLEARMARLGIRRPRA